MGRRHVHPDQDDSWVFNRLAGPYAARPEYPPALVEHLAQLAGRPGRVADLGAGLGHLALPLAARGLEVWAVEPARRMLDALRARAADRGVALHTVHAAAEATGLPDGALQLAVLADALHWVDPERCGRELRRILAPSGVVAVVEVELEDTPFWSAVRPLLEGHNPRARRRSRTGALEQLLTLAAGRAPRHQLELSDQRVLSPEDAATALASFSHVGPALGPAKLAAVQEAARALAERVGAQWHRRLRVVWVQLDGCNHLKIGADSGVE